MASKKPLVEYLKIEGSAMRELGNSLIEEMNKIQQELNSIQGSDRIGDQVKAMQARMTKRAMNMSIAAIQKNTEGAILKGYADAAAMASYLVSDDEKTLLRLISGDTSLANLAENEALRAMGGVETVMARRKMSQMPLSEQVYKTGLIAKGQVDKYVDRALVRGLSWGDFAKGAKDLIDPNTPGGVAYAAKRLARTEINNAFHAATAERYANSGVAGLTVDWNLSESHPTPDLCNKYEEDGPYDPEQMPKKPHPMCLCYVTANLPSEDDFLQNLFGKGFIDSDMEMLPPQAVAKVRKMEAKVPPKTTIPKSDLFSGWSKEEEGILYDYSINSFEMNKPNSDKGDSTLAQRVRALQAAIRRTNVGSEQTVRRVASGGSLGSDLEAAWRSKGLFRDNRFLSTAKESTYDWDEMLDYFASGPNPVLMEIKLKAKDKGVFIGKKFEDRPGSMGDQGEILLPRDTPLRVVGRRKEPETGAWIYEMEIDSVVKAPAPKAYAPDFSIEEGMSKAESARKILESTMYDRKGNYNKAAGWTSESARAWSSYTEMGHKEMNLLLRDPKAFAAKWANDPSYAQHYEQQVKLVMGILEKNKTLSDTVVARGVLVGPGFNPATFKAGDLFADPAFLSTTSNMKEALDFAAGRGRVDNADGWVFMIKVPKGTSAIPGADYQNELLFAPGQNQRVLGVDKAKKIIYTEMTS